MKRILSIILIIATMCLFVGCDDNDASDEPKIYYVNTDKDGVTAVDYEYKASDTDGRISEVLNKLAENPDSVDYIATIPAGVKINQWELDNGSLSLYFSGNYENLDVFTEILVRAAIVKSLTQIKGVDSVSFNVNGMPYTDSNGDAVGAMTADSFIDDFGQETDSLLSTELTLYFSSADGVSLVPEKRQVYYSRNVSLEKLLLEQLLKGPDTSYLSATLPSGTKINSISVSDNGVCIVNFDATLETAMTGVTEKVTVYSIVNTLTELDSVKQVQILVNGETPHLSNLDFDLSTAISRNDDIINLSIKDDNNSLEVMPDDMFIDDDEYLEDEGQPTEDSAN